MTSELIEQYEAKYLREPENDGLRRRLGTIYFLSAEGVCVTALETQQPSRFQIAQDLFSSAKQLLHDVPEFCLRCAYYSLLCCDKIGREDEAAKHLQTAISLHAGHPELGVADLDACEELFERAGKGEVSQGLVARFFLRWAAVHLVPPLSKYSRQAVVEYANFIDTILLQQRKAPACALQLQYQTINLHLSLEDTESVLKFMTHLLNVQEGCETIAQQNLGKAFIRILNAHGYAALSDRIAFSHHSRAGSTEFIETLEAESLPQQLAGFYHLHGSNLARIYCATLEKDKLLAGISYWNKAIGLGDNCGVLLKVEALYRIAVARYHLGDRAHAFRVLECAFALHAKTKGVDDDILKRSAIKTAPTGQQPGSTVTVLDVYFAWWLAVVDSVSDPERGQNIKKLLGFWHDIIVNFRIKFTSATIQQILDFSAELFGRRETVNAMMFRDFAHSKRS